ncbi:PTS mannose/fructose/sorbose/N-acetylgalactosamine transporter subunit IIC [Clostridium baratii]|uniref:PTS mannose/fructose/sorbose/N-acetylgalactosamine transporter subunit IIC n=1 Tax=Clostridium baratii TaxID=1561 RepID=UPI0006BA848D|nr:PTS sugar transporter subunit IIC [Clostridium baratii]
MVGEMLLVTAVAVLVTIDYNGPLLMLYRPLIAGSLVGLVLGDFQQGMIIGATLELMWLGVTAVGGYTPPDTISGAIVGTALGILSGHGVTAGVAIAVPVAVITQQLDVLAKTADIYFVKKADRDAENGDTSKIGLYHYLSLILIVLFKVVPIFAALALGSNYIKDLFDKIPPVIMTGLNVAGGILPAIGFAMLLNMMLKKKMWVYLLIGFVFAAFLKLSTIGIALLGLAVAYLGTVRTDISSSASNNVEFQSNEQEDLDL